jgi:hypothetical protein
MSFDKLPKEVLDQICEDVSEFEDKGSSFSLISLFLGPSFQLTHSGQQKRATSSTASPSPVAPPSPLPTESSTVRLSDTPFPDIHNGNEHLTCNGRSSVALISPASSRTSVTSLRVSKHFAGTEISTGEPA